MTRLSIIILSYNTQEVTNRCMQTLVETLSHEKDDYEIIVVDNASTDGSAGMLTSFKKKSLPKNIIYKLIVNDTNRGFTAGNNIGLKIATGTYVLFLNSDVIIERVEFDKLMKYLDKETSIGALTVAVKLKDGRYDMASHRGFPNLWNSFCYFSCLEKITAPLPLLNRLFGGYHLTYRSMGLPHEVDAISGAFFFTRHDLLRSLHGFDEDYFMYGEDVDLSYRIQKRGFKIMYYPVYSILHLKYQSGLKTSDPSVKSKTKDYFYDAMKIFFKKHYAAEYPSFITPLVDSFIDLKKRFS